MFRKHILMASLLLPFMAASSLAHAGPQPSDRAWWPNQAASSAPSRGYATELVAGRDQIAPQATGRSCRYHGNPRSPLVCSTR
jgi:hypothetical protein